ncbi:MAG: EAL domain-containing protein [Pseudobutyrivibrio sp.]|nr:EAL domain-containing protein [Pseudobutyrivibrio sp.]
MKSEFFNQIINAIETKELKAFYQPQYDANSGRLISAEALARWEKSDGTIVTPDDFIPVLEETDAICTLDWYMAEEVCRTIHEMGEFAIPIAVNFSRWHIREADFSRKLRVLIDTYDIEPGKLEVEITESALAVEDFSLVERWATEVVDLGVKLSIDDFGSGFTSLQFVKDLPVDFLKIDKAFLADNCQDERGRGTLETVFFFASKLNLRTIVEGVETLQQLKFLQNMDCDRVQGYLFSKPIRKEDFLVIAMFDNEPAVEENPLAAVGTFSSNTALLNVIRNEYQLIVFGNLIKNSYYLMSQSDDMTFGTSTAGVIDDMTEDSMANSPKGYDKIYYDNLSRQALINAYNEGRTRVEVQVKQYYQDKIMTLFTVVHLMKHPTKNDILMVGLSRIIGFGDE